MALNDLTSTVWWQFEKDFIMGEMRWVNMDSWSADMAELGYKHYQDAVFRGRQTSRPFEATYTRGSQGPIDFQFNYTENIYWMQNMKTGERCRLRRIEYVVTAPPSLRTNRS